MYKHILIATDGSDLARKGLDHGMELAKLLDAKVTILTVSEPLRMETAHAAKLAGVENASSRYDYQAEQLMKERFSFIGDLAREQGIIVELKHEIDVSPAEAIVRAAKLSACDLIVMSSHGRRGVQKLLLGSQTSEVLVKTTVPVLVIR